LKESQQQADLQIRALGADGVKTAKAVRRAEDFSRNEVAEELVVAWCTLWRALAKDDA
jgi:hypothetical protein